MKSATLLLVLVGVIALLETPVILVGPLVVVGVIVALAVRASKRSSDQSASTRSSSTAQ